MSPRASHPSAQDHGLALIEAIVATGLVLTALAAGASFVVAGGKAAADGAVEASGRVLALDKVEQLRALAFAVTIDGQGTEDIDADTAVDPPAAAGGAGLAASPDGTLESDVSGYVDYLSRDSVLVSSAADATIARRWAITHLADDVLRIDVCVVRRGLDRVRSRPWREGAGAVCLSAVRLRGIE